MSEDLDVRIARLEPMRVASFYGFGESPEMEAWGKLVAWAEPRGLLADRAKHRIFGFNNPNPSHGSPNYGYEFWVTVAPDYKPADEVRILAFPGGPYAVTRCLGADHIAETWHRLARWLAEGPHEMGGHQWLEEHLSRPDGPPDELLLDLYAPIAA